MEWQDISTAPKDGTVIDLWMVDTSGKAYREANAYWVSDRLDAQRGYKADGTIYETRVNRDGWWAPGHDYEGEDGWADQPKWFNEHPLQKRWVGRWPTHWMPLPKPPVSDQ